MSLLGAVLQSLSELGKSKVDSYRHFFDGHRPVEESMESFIGGIVQDFHLDNDIVKYNQWCFRDYPSDKCTTNMPNHFRHYRLPLQATNYKADEQLCH